MRLSTFAASLKDSDGRMPKRGTPDVGVGVGDGDLQDLVHVRHLERLERLEGRDTHVERGVASQLLQEDRRGALRAKTPGRLRQGDPHSRRVFHGRRLHESKNRGLGLGGVSRLGLAQIDAIHAIHRRRIGPYAHRRRRLHAHRLRPGRMTGEGRDTRQRLCRSNLQVRADGATDERFADSALVAEEPRQRRQRRLDRPVVVDRARRLGDDRLVAVGQEARHLRARRRRSATMAAMRTPRDG